MAEWDQLWHHLMLYLMLIWLQAGDRMRTTVTIDDELLEEAQRLTGIKERAVLIRMGLEALVQRECAHRLARMGGTQPDIQGIPRRRPD